MFFCKIWLLPVNYLFPGFFQIISHFPLSYRSFPELLYIWYELFLYRYGSFSLVFLFVSKFMAVCLAQFLSTIWKRFSCSTMKDVFIFHCIYFFFYFLVVTLPRCSYFNKTKFFSGQATDKRFVWERYHVQVLDQAGILAVHRQVSSSWYKIVFLSEFFWP